MTRSGTIDTSGHHAISDGQDSHGVQPDIELVEVPRNESFKVWSHGYPYRTVRWHCHPEYEIHLITETSGKYFVGDYIGDFVPGNLVMTGMHLPHNWVSSVPGGCDVDERSLVLQFDAQFISEAIGVFPELASVEPLLDASRRGVLFSARTGALAEPIFRKLLQAKGPLRISLFVTLLDLLARSAERIQLASTVYRADASQQARARINNVLSYIARNISQEMRETEFAELTGQSPSAFSRYFRRHTGVSFVQYINRLRINLACQLVMAGELSITDICFKVGFNNLSNFNRQFLLLQGMSPSRWRAQCLLNKLDQEASTHATHENAELI
ncbi:AraC family transcriptional regulator [Robbsia andropogonis]|uniref:AraC family transcriptional regulator n=1 Tax=Robbsia andropogonis TaxID=28092 RepID=UPI000467D8E0|nr:AraC family transcriptional regulator [Robbsia andropogonis]MCP1118244.1 AraC family transcriptional regulator [Robbsia andropogonis]MCP1127475.1 AraC family transcriptional regulator [Robbsia andropogonis]